MIVPSTGSVKNWQTPYLLKVECLRLKVICIPALGAPIWPSLRRNPFIVLIAIQLFFHAKAPTQNAKAAKKSFATLRNLSVFA
jgi:hypothetical protein